MNDEPIDNFLARQARSSTGQIGKSLGVAIRMLSSKNADGTRDWKQFAPTIARWESILGRKAPEAILDDGKLNPAFSEFMMGLPEGWLTDAPVSRADVLNSCGNGVVPQQAEGAIRRLLEVA